MREDLLPSNFQSLFRKSLAMIDEPEISFRYFSRLIRELEETAKNPGINIARTLHQINISLWIIRTWCIEIKNLEAAYLCAEFATLTSWEIAKRAFNKKGKTNQRITEAFIAIQHLQMAILDDFFEKVLPLFSRFHAFSGQDSGDCQFGY